MDKVRMLEMLAKHHGLLKESVAQASSTPAQGARSSPLKAYSSSCASLFSYEERASGVEFFDTPQA